MPSARRVHFLLKLTPLTSTSKWEASIPFLLELAGSGDRLRALKSVPNGVGRCFRTIGAMRLVQNVSDVGRDSIETDREHQRNILVRPPDSKQTQNLDFASREVVAISHTTLPGVQQGINIRNQPRHSNSLRDLL